MVEAGLDVDADDADVAEAGLESRLRAVAYLIQSPPKWTLSQGLGFCPHHGGFTIRLSLLL